MWTVTLHVRLESVRLCWKWVGDGILGGGGKMPSEYSYLREAMLLSYEDSLLQHMGIISYEFRFRYIL